MLSRRADSVLLPCPKGGSELKTIGAVGFAYKAPITNEYGVVEGPDYCAFSAAWNRNQDNLWLHCAHGMIRSNGNMAFSLVGLGGGTQFFFNLQDLKDFQTVQWAVNELAQTLILLDEAIPEDDKERGSFGGSLQGYVNVEYEMVNEQELNLRTDHNGGLILLHLCTPRMRP